MNDLITAPPAEPSNAAAKGEAINLPSLAQSTVADFIAGEFSARVKAIWRGARLVEYLTAPDARRHLWHAWLSAHGATPVDENAAATDLAYVLLSRQSAKALMEAAYGDCPPGLLNALGRLGAEARTRHAYRALVTVLARGGPAAKCVLHAKSPTDELIIGLAGLPRDQGCANVTIKLFLKSAFGAQKLGAFAWGLARIGRLYGEKAVDEIVHAADPWAAMWDALYIHDFPAPPWPAIRRLAPVPSHADFLDAAVRFNNCLTNGEIARRALRQIVNGHAYFYEWLGEEAALLKFQKAGALGWYLCEANGVRNAWLSESTRAEIARSIDGLDCVCPISGRGPVCFQMGVSDRFYVNDE
ncbi:MAG: hypothetical protein ABI306_06025 [Caulobacteraceae bacterium]